MQECMAAEVEAPLCKYGKLLPSFCFESRGPALAVEVRGRLLYALSGNCLAIYDISRPLRPRFLGESAPVRNARQLALREDGFAFVSARENGLWIIDVRNPAHPEVISRYDSVEMATGRRKPDFSGQPGLWRGDCRRLRPAASPAHFALSDSGIAVGPEGGATALFRRMVCGRDPDCGCA